jgi:hypothetical protein
MNYMVYAAACIIVGVTVFILLPIIIPLVVGFVVWVMPILLALIGVALIANDESSGGGAGIMLLAPAVGVYGYYLCRNIVRNVRNATVAKEAEKVRVAAQAVLAAEHERRRELFQRKLDEARHRNQKEEHSRRKAQERSDQQRKELEAVWSERIREWKDGSLSVSALPIRRNISASQRIALRKAVFSHEAFEFVSRSLGKNHSNMSTYDYFEIAALLGVKVVGVTSNVRED